MSSIFLSWYRILDTILSFFASSFSTKCSKNCAVYVNNVTFGAKGTNSVNVVPMMRQIDVAPYRVI